MNTNTGSIADKVAKAFGLCVVVCVVVQFHSASQAIKAELKQENACMAEAAAGKRDIGECFALMRNNNRE